MVEGWKKNCMISNATTLVFSFLAYTAQIRRVRKTLASSMECCIVLPMAQLGAAGHLGGLLFWASQATKSACGSPGLAFKLGSSEQL